MAVREGDGFTRRLTLKFTRKASKALGYQALGESRDDRPSYELEEIAVAFHLDLAKGNKGILKRSFYPSEFGKESTGGEARDEKRRADNRQDSAGERNACDGYPVRRLRRRASGRVAKGNLLSQYGAERAEGNHEQENRHVRRIVHAVERNDEEANRTDKHAVVGLHETPLPIRAVSTREAGFAARCARSCKPSASVNNRLLDATKPPNISSPYVTRDCLCLSLPIIAAVINRDRNGSGLNWHSDLLNVGVLVIVGLQAKTTRWTKTFDFISVQCGVNAIGNSLDELIENGNLRIVPAFAKLLDRYGRPLHWCRLRQS